ncbi:MAG: AAA family ATPase [Bacteroidota bacterium]|nr:AAA family ATPase [Bacteroidota bacterium]
MSDFNPFTLKNYLGPAYFCDREDELKILLEKQSNQRNCTLISNRKIGKTALIYHFFHQIKQQNSDIICLYIDLFATQNFNDLVKEIIKEIGIKFYPKPSHFIKNIGQIFSSIRPVITFDTLTGIPQIELNLEGEVQKKQTIDQIFDFLNTRKHNVIVAFDEFQQIANYPETNTEALLRTKIQNMHQVQFIFSGSNKHMLYQMFASAKRPFYQSTDFMYLNAIAKDAYGLFIKKHLIENKKEINDDTLEYLFQFTRVHTYFVQAMCNRLYNYPKKQLTIEHVKDVSELIFIENETFYINYRSLLTQPQWLLLKAIAKEDGASHLQSKEFIEKHHLSTHATVKRSLEKLLDTEMVFETEGTYYVQDVFLSRWLEKLPY